MENKILITGVSLVTPLGLSLNESWDNFKKNIDGISIMDFSSDTNKNFYVGKIAPIEENKKKSRWLKIFEFLIEDFKKTYFNGKFDFSDIPLIIASSFLGIENHKFYKTEQLLNKIKKYGFKKVIINSNSCSAGNFAIESAANLIKNFITERVIVVGIDILTKYLLLGFSSLKMISKTESKPFSKYRDGITLGEGGALIFLENLQSAVKRNSEIFCEYAGFGYSVDNNGMTGMDKSLNGMKKMYTRALKSAEVSPQEIDLICAHATGTKLNDEIEAFSIIETFRHRPKVTVFKSYIGHAMGASSAISAALLSLCIKEKKVIKIKNLISPEFDLNYANKNENIEINMGINNAFGFGGINSCTIFRKIKI